MSDKNKSNYETDLFADELGEAVESDGFNNIDVPDSPEAGGELIDIGEDPVEEEQLATYVVQKGFTVEGKTFHPGNVIPIKCKYCALWKKEWLGQVRCSPGKMLDSDTPFSPERFSCEAFFVCKELEAELDSFLALDVPAVLAIRRMIPSLKKLLSTEEWIVEWLGKADRDEDAQKILRDALGFAFSLSSVEQLVFAEDFIREYAKRYNKRIREKRPRKNVYRAGDWVEWVGINDEIFSGIILSIGGGLIKLAGVKAQSGMKLTYKYKEWKRDKKPKIIRQSAE